MYPQSSYDQPYNNAVPQQYNPPYGTPPPTQIPPQGFPPQLQQQQNYYPQQQQQQQQQQAYMNPGDQPTYSYSNPPPGQEQSMTYNSYGGGGGQQFVGNGTSELPPPLPPPNVPPHPQPCLPPRRRKGKTTKKGMGVKEKHLHLEPIVKGLPVRYMGPPKSSKYFKGNSGCRSTNKCTNPNLPYCCDSSPSADPQNNFSLPPPNANSYGANPPSSPNNSQPQQQQTSGQGQQQAGQFSNYPPADPSQAPYYFPGQDPNLNPLQQGQFPDPALALNYYNYAPNPGSRQLETYPVINSNSQPMQNYPYVQPQINYNQQQQAFANSYPIQGEIPPPPRPPNQY